jgi:2-polyprenyl-3-methyl-5-hydroxy-6-metoxy-1,4-benzoquinol methylase
MDCRVCGSGTFNTIFKTDKCPKYSHKYLAAPSNDTVTLEVLRCQECGLLQLSQDFPDDEYSSDYQRNISCSKSAVEHVDALADILVKHKVSNLMEIGCGNGLFLSAMKNRGVTTVGFEPSVAACKAAQANGLNVHNIFFDEQTPQEFKGYDSFALRFVLEHLSKPIETLKNIASRCNDGAIGLIEVPNAEKQIRNKKWFEFFREHTMYFTPRTLLTAINVAGFKMVEFHVTMHDEFLSIIVQKAPPIDYEWQEEEMKKQLLSLIEPGKRTWAWGASGEGVTLLCEAGITQQQIEFLVDSDKNKWGLYTSGSGIKIVPPSDISISPPDAVIIFTSVYEQEIAKALRAQGFTGKIGTVFPYPKWLEEKA